SETVFTMAMPGAYGICSAHNRLMCLTELLNESHFPTSINSAPKPKNLRHAHPKLVSLLYHSRRMEANGNASCQRLERQAAIVAQASLRNAVDGRHRHFPVLVRPVTVFKARRPLCSAWAQYRPAGSKSQVQIQRPPSLSCLLIHSNFDRTQNSNFENYTPPPK
ncbi:MAG: hypothetical protein WCS94_21550, partial [Verrucomicrobiota bacterium]